jgi:hypothetical protein
MQSLFALSVWCWMGCVVLFGLAAWCAKLVRFPAVNGVKDGHGSCFGHIGVENSPGNARVVQCMIAWATGIMQAQLHNATELGAHVPTFSNGTFGRSSKHAWLPHNWFVHLTIASMAIPEDV